MITQHVVTFGGEVTLTRLPAGRAEGYVWLSFVARGIETDTGPDEDWQIHDHIRLGWLDGSAPEVVEGGVSANESLHLFYVTVRDAGFNTLTINYVENGQVISSENVALPAAPAV